MNKVILMGRLTADPVLRQNQNGSTSCGFRIAINRRFANKQTGERDADFINCTAWGQTAEFVNRYFKKGSMICVEGQLRSSSYQDKKYSDVTHYTTDVFVDNVEFTGSKAESGTAGGYANNGFNGGYANNGGYPQQNNYGNGGYANNGGYPQQNNYNNGYPPQQSDSYNNGGYSAPAQTNAQNDSNSMSYGNMNDYEEIISDGNVPF